MNKIIALIPWALALFISGVFGDSLRFKFTGSPITEHIFTTLRDTLGIGLFHPAGPWIVGIGELISLVLVLIVPVVLVLMGLKRTAHGIQWIGALGALGVMTGAIVFHLFTPLGIETPTKVTAEGVAVDFSPALFITACFVWLSALVILIWRRNSVPAWVPVFGRRDLPATA